MLKEASRIPSKIVKNGQLGISVTIGCPPGPQDHQNDVPGTPKTTPKAKTW
jgi:hypothetical protein